MHLKHIALAAAAFRKDNAHWLGGIGCRVAFLVTSTLVLVALLVGIFLFREEKRSEEQEMRARALWLGQYVSLLVADQLSRKNRGTLAAIVDKAFLPEANFAGKVDHELRSLGVFDDSGRLLAVKTLGQNAGPAPATAEHSFPPNAADLLLHEPRLVNTADGMLTLTFPIQRVGKRVGFLRAVFAPRQYDDRYENVTRTMGFIFLTVVILGLLSSRIIARGIIMPIARLNEAVDELARQKWKMPIPVTGKDELSRLAGAFNQMALTLNEREASLSQGNRDLFILHTSGLDLMESRDLSGLFEKIASRTDDLIRADTVMISSVDPHSRTLRYLAAAGNKARMFRDLDLPLEAGGIYNWMASYGTPVLIQDATADTRLHGDQMRELGVRSLIAVPLWSSNALIAVLTAVNKKGGERFDRHDLRLLTVFAGLAASALQNASLFDDLRQKMYELEQTQLQLLHSTKLAAIGELATNLAHEINNPLTSVLGYTSHLLKTLNVSDESRHKLSLMEQETLRVRRIIRNLLDFSRQKSSRMRRGDLAAPIRETIALLQGVAESGKVAIQTDLPALPVAVNMDHNELKQVFINIINNALHAMPDGGLLQIRLHAVDNSSAVLAFEDNGHGIPADHISKVFDPFFTTKTHGDGTGLGLSISYRIVQNHGGRMEVQSLPRQGTVFTIILPLAPPVAGAEFPMKGIERDDHVRR